MAEYATRDDIAHLRGQRMDPWFNDMKYVRKGELYELGGISFVQIQSRPDNSLVPVDKISYIPPIGNLIMNSTMGDYGSYTSGAFLSNSLPDFYEEWDGGVFIGHLYRTTERQYTVRQDVFSSWSAVTHSGQYVIITDFDDDDYFYRFWYYQLQYADIQAMDSGSDVQVSIGYKIVPLQ